MAKILLALLGAFAVAHAATRSDIGELKLQKMRKLRDESSDGIVEFSAQEYL